MSEPVITNVVFSMPFYSTVVRAQMDNSAEWIEVVEYYSDEISFSRHELMGKTQAQVSRMHFEKDKAYIQS